MDNTLPVAVQINIGNKQKDRSFLLDLASRIVEKYTVVSQAFMNIQVQECGDGDGVYNYACTMCHLASLVMEFTDAWAEGDGEQVVRCWRFFLLHFYSGGRTKYALEALLLQFQIFCYYPTLSHQVIHGRFVNSKGGLGHNIPCDLYNEHVNRIFKEVTGNMGSNFTQKSSMRVAHSVTFLEKISLNLDNQCGVTPETTAHSTKCSQGDIRQVVKVLCTQNSFQKIPGRSHSNFRLMSSNPLKSLNWDKMERWIKLKALDYEKHSTSVKEGNISDEEVTDDEEEGDKSHENKSG